MAAGAAFIWLVDPVGSPGSAIFIGIAMMWAGLTALSFCLQVKAAG